MARSRSPRSPCRSRRHLARRCRRLVGHTFHRHTCRSRNRRRRRIRLPAGTKPHMLGRNPYPSRRRSWFRRCKSAHRRCVPCRLHFRIGCSGCTAGRWCSACSLPRNRCRSLPSCAFRRCSRGPCRCRLHRLDSSSRDHLCKRARRYISRSRRPHNRCPFRQRLSNCCRNEVLPHRRPLRLSRHRLHRQRLPSHPRRCLRRRWSTLGTRRKGYCSPARQ